ncbi:MAG: hypothetical protein HXY25_12160 [Alphaproteobacteria bacterium]|nr:hypothetical protein [Alphaproteobacteria bacterium]
MRSGLLVLALLLGIAGLLAMALLTPEIAGSAGAGPPEIAGMRIGGDGAARWEPIAFAGFLLQCLTIGFVGLLVVMSVPRRLRSKGFWAGLLLYAGLALFVWIQINTSYRHYLQSSETSFFLGFPTPSAWMIYGVWSSALILVGLYVFGFRRFVLTREDEARFEALLAERRRTRGGM